VIFIGGVGSSAPRPAWGALTPPMKKNHTSCFFEQTLQKLNNIEKIASAIFTYFFLGGVTGACPR